MALKPQNTSVQPMVSNWNQLLKFMLQQVGEVSFNVDVHIGETALTITGTASVTQEEKIHIDGEIWSG